MRIHFNNGYCLPLFAVFSFLAGPAFLAAQHGYEDSLLVARTVRSGNYGRVAVVTDSVLRTLPAEASFGLPPYLYIREQMAYAYDRMRQEEKALLLARAVVEDATAAGDFRSAAEATLTEALIMEKYQLGADCAEDLRRAWNYIERYDLPETKARYYVRKASYQRIFQGGDSLGYYAQLAIDAGKESGSVRAISEGTFLYNIANGADKSLVYRTTREALRYSREAGQVDLYMHMLYVLTQEMLKFGDVIEARAVNEEALEELTTGFGKDYIDPAMLPIFHAQEMELAEARGDYRTAFEASKRVLDLERRTYDLRLQQNVQEIEARFSLEQKENELRVSEAEVTRQTQHKEWILHGLLIALGFIGMLGYQTFRLRRTRRALAGKARELNRANLQLEDAVNEQVMLRSELHHRVKNNLQVIISLLSLQEQRVTDEGAKSSLRSTSERVYSMAAVHELLYPKQQYDRISFKAYLDKLCDHAAQMWPEGYEPVVRLDVDDQTFNLDTLVPLGVIVSELLTNSRKNFADSAPPPVIGIGLWREGELFELRYRDNGPGFPQGTFTERPGGIGGYLVKSMARQLSGNVLTYNEQGAVTEVRFRARVDHTGASGYLNEEGRSSEPSVALV